MTRFLNSSKGGVSFILAAILVVSGFFVAGNALAAHTATVNVDRLFVKGSQTAIFNFTITKNSGSDIEEVDIDQNDFDINSNLTNITCPFSDWAKEATSHSVKCFKPRSSSNRITSVGTLIISATAPGVGGPYNWNITTWDISDPYTPTAPVTNVDTVAPITSDNAPSGWQTTSPVVINLTCSDDGGSGCAVPKYTTDGSDPKASGTVQTGPTISLSNEGTITIKYYSIDVVGNEENVITKQVQIDTVPPTTLDDATDDWKNASVTVTLTVNDVSSGSKNTYYSTDGTPPVNAYSSPFTIETEGEHQLIYYSVDNANNQESPVTGHNVKIDKSKPITSFAINPTSPSPSGWYNVTPTITLNCTDQPGLSGCKKTYYKWDGGSYAEYTVPIPVQDGNNTLYYYSTDKATNEGVALTQNIKVDIGIPTITNDAPTAWQKDDVSFNLTPNDAGSEIKEVKYCEGILCDPSSGTPISAPYLISYTTENVFIGRYQTWDNAGNPSDIGSYTVRIDKTLPVAGVSGASPNWTNTDQTASVTCTDLGGSDCDSASYKYRVDTVNPEACSANESDYISGSSVLINQHSWVCSYVKDIARNVDFSDSPTEFKVDKTPPTGGLTGVSGDWQKTDASIDLTYGDTGDSGVLNKYLTIVSYGNTCNPTTLYTQEITVSQRSTACWLVTDNAGNSVSDSSEIKVDKIPPTSGITSPDAGSWYKADFNVTVADSDSGGAELNLCEYQVQSNGATTKDWTTRICNSSVPLTVGDGQDCRDQGTNKCTVLVRSTDKAGNVAAVIQRNFSTDWTVPTANISSPGNGDIIRSSSVGLTFTNSGTFSPVSKCFYQIDQSTRQEISGCTSPYTITNAPEGRHSFKIIVQDSAGNEADSNIISNLLIDSDKTFTVGTGADFATIQDAVANAQTGYTINVADGTYTLSETLNLTLSGLKISGASQSGVIINAGSVNGYGIAPSVNNIILEKFTLNGPTVLADDSYGIKASHFTGLTISNVTVVGSGRSEIDLNTVNTATLENVTANGNNTAGAGIALTNSSNITLTNINTTGNTWGGVGLFDSVSGPTSDVVFTGTNNFGESNPVYIDTANGFPATNITLPGFTHAVRNSLNPRFTSFQQSESVAVGVAIALGPPVSAASYVQTLGTDGSGHIALQNNFIVGNGMSIQTAITAAISGATINVAAGTYNESVLIEKQLTLTGVGIKPVISGVVSKNYIVKVNGVNGVVIDNLEINGGGDSVGDNAFDYGIFINNSGTNLIPVEIKNVTVKNVWKNSGNGMGIENSSYVLTHNNTVSSFHKNGIRFIKSNGKFYGNEVIGDNVDGTNRVQNLVNIRGGSNVEIYGNTLHNALTNPEAVPTWDSTAIIISAYLDAPPYAGSYANIHENEIYDSDSGIVVGSVYAANDNSSATISKNDLHNLNWAINFEQLTASAVITNNKFSNNTKAVNAEAYDPIVPGPITNAEMNWWNSINGPAVNDVFAEVDYRPWCLEESCTTIDNQAPAVVTITSTLTSPTKVSPIPITVTFSEPVSNFEAEDVVVTNGIAGSFSGSATTYNFSVTPNGQGAVKVDVPASVAWDASGNYNTQASQFSINYDSIAATLNPVTITTSNGNTEKAKVGDTITLNFTSNETIQTPVVTIAVNSAAVTGSDKSWTATYKMTSIDTEGPIPFAINFSDLAGNSGQKTETTDQKSVSFDRTAAVLNITSPLSGTKVNETAKIIFTDTELIQPQFSRNPYDWIGCISNETALSHIEGFTNSPDGPFTLYLHDTDDAGNVGTVSVSLVKDTMAPSVVESSLSPSRGAVGVDPDMNISVKFSEAVVVGTQNIVLKKSDAQSLITLNPNEISFDPSTYTLTINRTASLENNSEYTVTLTGVTDEAGNLMADYNPANVWKFTTATRYSIDLTQGWNLISLPVTPTTWRSIADVLSGLNNIVRVWTYDAVSGKWLAYTPGSPETSNLASMEAGRGYWVQTNAAGTLTGSGTLYEQLIPSGDVPSGALPQIQLAEGWNMIGYYQLPNTNEMLIGKALSKLMNAWSGDGNDLIAFTKGTLQIQTPIYTMSPGQGYWIYMGSAKKYSFGSK